jgi:hypothetical protein
LYTWSFGSERESTQKCQQCRNGQKKDARDPSEVDDTPNGGDRGGNAAPSAAAGIGEKKARQKSQKGSTRNEKRKPYGIFSYGTVKEKGYVNNLLHGDLKGCDKERGEKTCHGRECKTWK